MKIMNYFMIALFAYSAVVQLNDPEPALWVILYLTAMGFCAAWAMKKLPVVPAFVFSAANLIVGLYFLYIALNREVLAWDEHMNEAGGPLVIFLWVSSLAWIEWKKKAVS